MTRETIERRQLESLRRLLDEIAPRNRFYGPMLRNAGLDGHVASLEQFSERMPLTRKDMLVEDQRRHPPFGTNLTYPIEHYCRFNQTSATTHGSPLRWLDTAESWQWMVDNWKVVFEAAGVTCADRLYFAFSFGPFLGFWTAFDAATQIGCLSIPGGGLRSIARLEAMRDNGVTVLLCTPTYAMRLAEVAGEERFDLRRIPLRRIVVAGEPGGSVPAVRERIEQAWQGAVVFDHHGMTEVGPVSYQPPDRRCCLRVIETSYFAEILQPGDMRPVAPGEIGELVLTTLGRAASPLLRYRTGDLVRRPSEAASATYPGMLLEGGILGRTDDMVLVRGVNIYPAAIDQLLRSFAEIAEYCVEMDTQKAMTEIRVRVEPVHEEIDAEQLANRVQARIHAQFHVRVPVTVAAPASLPRFEMKARRWVQVGQRG